MSVISGHGGMACFASHSEQRICTPLHLQYVLICINNNEMIFFLGNGQCIAFDTCECTSGWSGPSCSIHDCNIVNQCSNQGECVGPNACQCFGGYEGVDCSVYLDCSHLNNCSGNGICVFNNDVTGDTNICRCVYLFS